VLWQGATELREIRYRLPNGGVGPSGIGRDCFRLALEDYLVDKRISRAA